jgi:hypothetical protein
MPSSSSNVYLNVDICAAIVADKPPQLPLREELNSLGFEVVLAAPGTGIRASKYESKKALKRFRKNVATKDLKKTRLFPRSPRQIKRLLEERRKIEEELGLPHACSYETYHIKVKNSGEVSENDRSVASFDSNRKQKHRWGMFSRRRQSLGKKDDESDGSSDEQRKFRRTAAQALFPNLSSDDAMNSSDDDSKFSSAMSTQSNKSGSILHKKQHEVLKSNDAAWNHVFDALYDSSSNRFISDYSKSGTTNCPPSNPSLDNDASHVLGGVPDVFGAFDGMDDDFSELLAKGEVDQESIRSFKDHAAAANRIRVDPDGISQTSGQPFDETLQYSMSSEKGGIIDSPSSKKVSFFDDDDPFFSEEKKDDDPLIVAFVESEVLLPDQKSAPSLNVGNASPFEELTDSFYLSAGMDHSAKFPTDLQKIKIEEKRDESEDEAKLQERIASNTEALDQDVADICIKKHSVTNLSQPQEEVPAQSEPMSAFERATAEILRVAGIEPSKTQLSPSTEISPASETGHNHDWITSAKTVFDNFSTGVLKVAGIDKNAGNSGHGSSNEPNTSPSRIVDISTLFASIVLFDIPSKEIEEILSGNPELAQVRRNKDGRLPLHELCNRGMPDRSGFPISTLTDFLLKDIASYKALVFILVDCFPEGCAVQDRYLDLPVHLMARKLMEWEATWYEIVYQKASKERNADGATALAITKLYHAMSEAIDKLLRPLLENRDSANSLCRSTGSMGTILPLHIASIFTVSVKSLRLILEAYPEAAKIPCDLGILRTFIPDECLPLELHDNLSTDFPKWEIVSKAEGVVIEDSDGNDEDGIRRSDLLFAYNPIEHHRLEKTRIRRIESRLQYDALILEGKTTKRLDSALERLWVWICTFQEPDTGRSTYVNSVRRIISSLPLHSLRYLVSVKAESGQLLIDIASTECLKTIQMRLEQLHEVTASVERSQSTDSMVSIYDKELVGQLCRLVFNVPNMPIPTSFIVLPYKLNEEADGSLHLSSTDSASVALQFADCLLNLTDPRSILFFLDMKAKNHYDQRIYSASVTSDFQLQESSRVNGFADALWSLYESGDAFLYLLDESTGLPRIDSSSTVYPITLSSPATLVQKLLPLMLMSMVQMRGDKAILKLVNVIIDDHVAVIPPSWPKAADILVNYLESSDDKMEELKGAVDSLKKFRQDSSSKLRINTRPKNGSTEWNSELSMLKMLLEINDPDRTFAGLIVSYLPDSVDVDLVDEGISDDVDANERTEDAIPLMQARVEPDIIDLSRKMDALSELQHCINNDDSQGFFSRSHNHYDEEDSADILKKNVRLPYSLLVEDISSLQHENVSEERDDNTPEAEIRIWNAVDRVWENVTLQLNSRNEYLREDSQIIHLKVALAEQAKKLSDLGKKVLQLKDEERRLTSHSTYEVYDLTDVYDSGDTVTSSRDSLSHARKLVTRMGDLEARLVCNEIKIQHLSMEAFSLEHDGDTMVELLENPVTENMNDSEKFNREVSGISWGNTSSFANHRSQNSFLRYEKKVVRFNDAMAEDSKEDSAVTPVLVLDEYSDNGSWYPIIEIQESPPSTPSTYNSSRVQIGEECPVEREPREFFSGPDPDGCYLGDDQIWNQTVHERSLIDADSTCQTSEPSCSSILLNVLSAADATNTVSSEVSKSRYQKLVAKKKKIDKLSMYQKSPDGLLSTKSPYVVQDAGDSTNDSRNERIFSNPYTADTISVATADAVFRPASSITFPNLVQREISAMSSDKSLSSDLQSARKVVEIEKLISRYTFNADVV